MHINSRELERIGGVARNPDIAHAMRLLELSGVLVRSTTRTFDASLTDAEWDRIKKYLNTDSQTNFEMALDSLLDFRKLS